MTPTSKPWPALWALVVGFFMILVDTTIVSVVNPRIMQALGADINSVIWVTSAYLLAHAAALAGAVLCFFFVPRVANKGWGAAPAAAVTERSGAEATH